MASVRTSKFRHVYGNPVKRELCYDNTRLTKNAFDSNLAATNGKYISLNWASSGGGSFAVIPTSQPGKLPERFPLFSGHKGAVLDTAWNPFDDEMVVSASDDGTIGVWRVPAGFDVMKEYSDLDDIQDINPVKFLKGHSKRVGHLAFNPVADNILASSSLDHTIKIWDIDSGEVLYTLEHPDLIASFTWNFDGTKIASVCKDKKIRVWDVRNEKVLSEGPGHAGAKASRIVWLGDTDRLFTTGFSKLSDRQIAVWDAEDIAKGPLGGFRPTEPSSGVLIPFFDAETNIVYLGGRGEGRISYLEFLDDDLHELFSYQSIAPQRGLAFAPDRALNIKDHEVARIYKIHETMIEPIPFIVPRKTEGFLSDIYRTCRAGTPALSKEEFRGGANGRPLVVSWKAVYEGTDTEPAPAEAYDQRDQRNRAADARKQREFEKKQEEHKIAKSKKDAATHAADVADAKKDNVLDAFNSDNVKTFLAKTSEKETSGDEMDGDEKDVADWEEDSAGSANASALLNERPDSRDKAELDASETKSNEAETKVESSVTTVYLSETKSEKSSDDVEDKQDTGAIHSETQDAEDTGRKSEPSTAAKAPAIAKSSERAADGISMDTENSADISTASLQEQVDSLNARVSELTALVEKLSSAK